MTSLIQLPIDPDAFYEGKQSDEGLRGPVAMVTLAAFASVLSPILILNRFSASLPATDSAFVGLSFSIGILMGFLFVYVGWIAVTALAYGVAVKVFDPAVRDFRSLFRLVGWGFLPAIPAGIVSGLAAYLVYYGVEMPSDPDRLTEVVASLSGHPIFAVSQILMALFTVWQGFLWVFAIKYATELELNEAAAVAAVPTGITLVVQLGLA